MGYPAASNYSFGEKIRLHEIEVAACGIHISEHKIIG
jgi:hypothetical protein